MTKYEKCGPYVLTEEVQKVAYGRLMRAVRTEGKEFMEHLLVFIPSDEARQAGFDAALERNLDWFTGLDGIPRTEKLHLVPADGRPIITLSHMRGQSLSAILQKDAEDNKLQIEHILSIARDLVFAISNIHSAGYAHGALNLDGIWMDIDGPVHVLDVPLGKVLIQTGFQKQVLGPLADAKRHFGLDFANDQETFGIILFYLLARRMPDRAALEADVQNLCVTRDDCGEQEIIEIQPFKQLILRAIQGGYKDAKTIEKDMSDVFENTDDRYAPSTFDAAYVLRTLFREEMQAENEAIDIEKSHIFVESVGESIIEYREDRTKTRRAYARALVLTIIGLIAVGFLYIRSNHIKREAAYLVAQANTNKGNFERYLAEMRERIDHAKTADEKAALMAEVEQRAKEYEAEQAVINSRLEALKKKGLGNDIKKVELPPVTTVPQSLMVPQPMPVAPPAEKETVLENVAPPKLEKPKIIENANIPFTPSVKLPMNAPENATVQNEKPVYLSTGTQVEVLKKPEPKGGSASAGPAPAIVEPTVSVKDQNTASRFRKLVLPQLDKSTLKEFEGHTVRVRILVDQFGNPKAATVEECPQSLMADFKAAAMKTLFNPTMENGRAKQGWVAVSFHVTGSGVSLD